MDVWVAKDDGTEIIRARDIAAVSLDYNGNVTARLAGGDAVLVTLVAQRTHHDEHRPGRVHDEPDRLFGHRPILTSAGAVRARVQDPGDVDRLFPARDEEAAERFLAELLHRNRALPAQLRAGPAQ